MTHVPDRHADGDLTDLRKRVDSLESRRVRKWVATVLLPSLIIPVAVTLATHFFIDRPAESDEFEAKFDYGYDQTTKRDYYVLKITNTGWQRATDVLGRAEVNFKTKITAIDEISMPPNTTFGDHHFRNTNVCEASKRCRINWGGLVPEGSLEIAFYTEGPPSGLPTVRYGGKRIFTWHCLRLPYDLSAYCVGDEP